MKLEGTLDAFSLPDIFQLLSYTKKTGTLHLRREDQHGVVHLRDGAVTGGRSSAASQALGRRLVGAGLVDDEALADAAERVLDQPGAGLGKVLADAGAVDRDALSRVAAEQATDAVFELLRWPDGAFAFVMDELDPDDVGIALSVEDVVAEGRRREEAWAGLAEKVPSPAAVVALAPAPSDELVLNRDEWSLLSLVDGNRTVADLVMLSGTGEFVVVSALAGLAERGLVVIGAASAGATTQRQQLLAALEGGAQPSAAATAPSVPEPSSERRPVIPERPEPFTPERQPAYAEAPMPALARLSATAPTAAATASPTAAASSPAPAPTASVGAVQGAHALQPDAVPAPSPHIDRDPSVNKSLLLRLIAGVRGL
ncbi:MAG: DUF4388 domain-containing protein [Mycobacteriales bacterium]